MDSQSLEPDARATKRRRVSPASVDYDENPYARPRPKGLRRADAERVAALEKELGNANAKISKLLVANALQHLEILRLQNLRPPWLDELDPTGAALGEMRPLFSFD